MKLEPFKMVPFLALFGLAMATMGAAPGEAKADFMVDLTVDGGPSWAKSQDTTRVYFQRFGSAAWEFIDSARMNAFGVWEFTYRGPFDADDVRTVKVTTDGTDASFVDHVTLRHIGGSNDFRIEKRWETPDNGIGYCFSRDRYDGNSIYCWRSTAYQSITFPR